MRGNLTGVTRGEKLIKSFTFDATNRMTMSSGVKDGIRKRANYRYNGLGQRVGQRVYENDNINPEKEIHYTLDLTRQYHNLLNLKDNITDKDQTYYESLNEIKDIIENKIQKLTEYINNFNIEISGLNSKIYYYNQELRKNIN